MSRPCHPLSGLRSIFQSPIALSQKGAYKNKQTCAVQGGKVSEYKYDEKAVDWKVASGVTITNNGEKYTLRHFHLHTPAEHPIEKKIYDMEMHYVFESRCGATYILAVCVKVSDKATKTLSQIARGRSFHLPKIRHYWSYVGSIPPGGNVMWNVAKDVYHVSKKDYEILASMSKGSREVAPTEGRDVRYS